MAVTCTLGASVAVIKNLVSVNSKFNIRTGQTVLQFVSFCGKTKIESEKTLLLQKLLVSRLHITFGEYLGDNLVFCSTLVRIKFYNVY